MHRYAAVAAVLIEAWLSPRLEAIDHSNLDERRPLRLEDPYPLAHGEFAFEGGLGARFERFGPNRGEFFGELLYGAFPNFHAGLGAVFESSPGSVEGFEKSGDIRLDALYNFNQETVDLPAIAVKVTVNFPSGVDSAGTDMTLKALLAKSVDRLTFHFNGAYTVITGTRDSERGGQYEILLGASYPLGAPQNTRVTVLADVLTRQSVFRGEKNVYGVEVGVRYQLGTQTVLDAGAGSEFAGPRERAPFYFTSGLSIGF
jgi:hypothetical protein